MLKVREIWKNSIYCLEWQIITGAFIGNITYGLIDQPNIHTSETDYPINKQNTYLQIISHFLKKKQHTFHLTPTTPEGLRVYALAKKHKQSVKTVFVSVDFTISVGHGRGWKQPLSRGGMVSVSCFRVPNCFSKTRVDNWFVEHWNIRFWG